MVDEVVQYLLDWDSGGRDFMYSVHMYVCEHGAAMMSRTTDESSIVLPKSGQISLGLDVSYGTPIYTVLRT